MPKFTYTQAQNTLRIAEANTQSLEEFILHMLMHIRKQDPRFVQMIEGIQAVEFGDQIEFIGWFYRYFVGELDTRRNL